MTGERLVDRIVGDLEHHVVEARPVVGVADIHSGPFADRVEALQHLDRIGAVAVFTGGCCHDQDIATGGRETQGKWPDLGLVFSQCGMAAQGEGRRDEETARDGAGADRLQPGFAHVPPAEINSRHLHRSAARPGPSARRWRCSTSRRGGVRINGIAYTAAGAGPHPVLVLMHGLPGNEKNLDLAQAVRRAGWTVVTFNYRGSWGSPGRFSFAGNLDDAKAVLAWLRDPANAARLAIDPRRIVARRPFDGRLGDGDDRRARPRPRRRHPDLARRTWARRAAARAARWSR